MKLFKLTIVLLSLLIIAIAGNSQSIVVVKDKSGKFVNTIQSDSLVLDKPMGIYKDNKGVEYPMYESKKGKVYIIRTSKTSGKKYKQYLKISK